MNRGHPTFLRLCLVGLLVLIASACSCAESQSPSDHAIDEVMRDTAQGAAELRVILHVPPIVGIWNDGNRLLKTIRTWGVTQDRRFSTRSQEFCGGRLDIGDSLLRFDHSSPLGSYSSWSKAAPAISEQTSQLIEDSLSRSEQPSGGWPSPVVFIKLFLAHLIWALFGLPAIVRAKSAGTTNKLKTLLIAPGTILLLTLLKSSRSLTASTTAIGISIVGLAVIMTAGIFWVGGVRWAARRYGLLLAAIAATGIAVFTRTWNGRAFNPETIIRLLPLIVWVMYVLHSRARFRADRNARAGGV